MRAIIAAACGLAILGSAGSALANSYSVSGGRTYSSDGSDFEFIQLPVFDTSLGRLQSISYELYENMSETFYASPYDPSPPSSVPVYWSAGGYIDGAGDALNQSGTLNLFDDYEVGVYSTLVGFASLLQFDVTGTIPLASVADFPEISAYANSFVILADDSCPDCTPGGPEVAGFV